MKGWSRLIIFFVVLLLVMGVAPARAAESVLIRARIAYGFTNCIIRPSAGSYEVVTAEGTKIAELAPGQSVTVGYDERSGMYVSSAAGGSLASGVSSGVFIRPLKDPGGSIISFQGTRYRGELRIYAEKEALLAVNVLDMDKYLYGVLAKEFGHSGVPLEALKAQAVASRSFAYTYLGRGSLWDVTADESTQVYGGYDAELQANPDIRKAVDLTRGEVITYDGKVIPAYFHSNAGGHTENSENVWSEAYPYLRGVPSPWDAVALEYPKQVKGWPANNYRWEKVYTREELEARIASFNASYPGDAIKVGTIKKFHLERVGRDGVTPTPSGRVTRMDIIGTEGTKTFYRDAIRRVFGTRDLRSTLFEIEYDSSVWILGAGGVRQEVDGEALVSLGAGTGPRKAGGEQEVYYVQGTGGMRLVPKLFTKVVFKGKGFGHGVGMSQWGAYGMAQEGYNYREIIEHYYNQDKFDGRLQVVRKY